VLRLNCAPASTHSTSTNAENPAQTRNSESREKRLSRYPRLPILVTIVAKTTSFPWPQRRISPNDMCECSHIRPGRRRWASPELGIARNLNHFMPISRNWPKAAHRRTSAGNFRLRPRSRVQRPDRPASRQLSWVEARRNVVASDAPASRLAVFVRRNAGA
jgi:hypothetical protein